MYEVVEGDTPDLVVNFYNESKVLTAPTSAKWSAIDDETGQSVLTETDILPIASSVQLSIPSSITTIINDSKKFETKKIIIEATFGASKKKFATLLLKVENLVEAG